MNDKPMITQKQFFILLFVCRISLAIIYSSSVSGVFSVWDMLMPLIITIPLMLIMFLPSLSYGRISGDGSFFTVKIMPVIYSAYFLFSALYSTAVMYGFMLEAVPDGSNTALAICQAAPLATSRPTFTFLKLNLDREIR